jgi:hypothetical protein
MRKLPAVAAAALFGFAAPVPALGATQAHEQQCAAAQHLASLGREADAVNAYFALAKAGVPCPGETAALHPGFRRRITDFVSEWWAFALYAALVAGFAFAVLSWFRAVRAALRHVPLVRRAFDPAVSIGQFDDSAFGPPGPGAATSALVQQGLRRLNGNSLQNVAHIGVATGVENLSTTVAQLGGLASQFNAAAAVIGFLTRAMALPQYQLSATLQPDGGQGVGLSLRLDRRSRSVDAVTLWQEPGMPAGDTATFQLLATAAAAWTEYAVRKDENLTKLEFDTPPRSYAYFRSGGLYQLYGLRPLAEQAYRTALAIDGGSAGALSNLGGMRATDEDYDGAATLHRNTATGERARGRGREDARRARPSEQPSTQPLPPAQAGTRRVPAREHRARGADHPRDVLAGASGPEREAPQRFAGRPRSVPARSGRESARARPLRRRAPQADQLPDEVQPRLLLRLRSGR